MKLHKLIYGASALLMTGLVSCVDNGYDLSDIDTTSRLTVDDLVIPVNIDEVTLGDIITFDEDSRIKPIEIGGKTFYALTEEGEFNSDPIYIEKVHADAPILTSTEDMLEQVPYDLPASSRRRASSMPAITYNITDMGNTFSYKAFEVDDAIEQITSATVTPLRFGIKLNALNLNSNDVDMTFTDLVIVVAKGLTATTNIGKYDSKTGLWTIPTHKVQGHTTEAVLTATVVDFNAAGAHINDKHEFIFDGEFRVKSGYLTITPKSVNALPDNLHFRADYTLDEIEITSLDGVINYRLDGMSIDPISLADIPDFLNGDGTNIRMRNPQLYLSLNNPIADEHLTVQTGLSITAKRDNYRPLEFAIDNGSFSIGYNYGVAGPYNMVFAPSNEDLNTPDEFARNLQYVPYTQLSDILSVPGSNEYGMPDELVVNVNDPQIPRQTVRGFALGREIPGVKGKYEFVAPLDLDEGSLITYTDRQDGWNDETIDAVTITKLKLTATVTNNTPLAVSLVAYPLDIQGNVLTGVEATSNTLEANSTSDVVIELTGEVTHLDGVEFRATVSAGPDGKALAPDQTISLSNIRARISGYYEKEL